MAWQLQVRGPDVFGGGATPDEHYGAGEWGPAVFGVLNESGLTDYDASTFSTAELARIVQLALLPFRLSVAPSLEFRIVEV